MAALDVMAFSNDIDLASGAEAATTAPTARPELKAEDIDNQEVFISEDPLRKLVSATKSKRWERLGGLDVVSHRRNRFSTLSFVTYTLMTQIFFTSQVRRADL